MDDYRVWKIAPTTPSGWGPISVGVAEFLELEAIHLSIMLGTCHVFTVIYPKSLN